MAGDSDHSATRGILQALGALMAVVVAIAGASGLVSNIQQRVEGNQSANLERFQRVDDEIDRLRDAVNELERTLFDRLSEHEGKLGHPAMNEHAKGIDTRMNRIEEVLMEYGRSHGIFHGELERLKEHDRMTESENNPIRNRRGALE